MELTFYLLDKGRSDTWGFGILWFQPSEPSPEWGNGRRSPQVGFCPHSWSYRDENPADAGTFLRGFDPFVVLHLHFLGGNSAWSWVELQAQALMDTRTPREPLGVVESPAKVGSKGFLPQGLCPVLHGTGSEFPRPSQTFVQGKFPEAAAGNAPVPAWEGKRATQEPRAASCDHSRQEKQNIFMPGMERNP